MDAGSRPTPPGESPGHFILPFLFLLPRETKRRRASIVIASLWILGMHYADLYWLVMPNLHPDRPRLQPVDALTLAGIVAIAGGVVARFLSASHLIAAGDPALVSHGGNEFTSDVVPS